MTDAHGPIALIDENVPVIVIAPGNDLYLVYTQNWQNLRGDQFDTRFTGDQLDPRFTTLSRGLSTKLNYTFRF